MKTKFSKILAILLVFIAQFTFGQQNIVSGKVSDVNGLPLPGASIIIKGTSRGVSVDFDGNYSINANQGEIVVFSFVGYISKEIIVGASKEVDIILHEDRTALEEVVIIGFGSQSKRLVTDNIASITSENINGIPTPSMQNAIVGKAAGVQITQINGKVEGGVKVRVRGISTITSSQEPLYVVDGVPLINSDESINNSPINPLVTLNPNDIESIEILKDASSAAIYGARGSNGVILITTKQGELGKTKVSINSSYGWSQATNTVDFLNADEYVELISESFANVGDSADGVLDFFANGDGWRRGEINTDWQDIALKSGSTSNNGVSISGGTEKTNFFISGAHNNTEGIVRGNELNRHSFRANISHIASDKLKVGVNSNFSKSRIDRISNDNAFATPLQAIAQVPISVAFNQDGTPNNDTTLYYNFLTEEFNGDFQTNIWRLTSNLYGEYTIIPSLSFRTDFGYDFNNQVAERFSGSLTESASVGGFGTANAVETERYNLNSYFTYNKTIGDGNHLNAVVGIGFEETRRKLQFLQAQGFPSDDLRTLDSASDIVQGGSNKTAFNFLSYFARTTYSIKDKYLFKASIRYDGSSRFGEDNRYGWFPATSAGWIMSEEDFLKDSSLISFLKFRGSWGITGNAGIGDFASLSLFQGSPYNQRAALAPTQLGESSLKWETTTQYDIGVDFGVLKNRVSFELDYYIKNTEDLLLNEPVAGTSGFSSITRNVGEMQNKGIEFVLKTKNIVTNDFTWNTNFNIAANKNEVTSLPGGDIIVGRSLVKEGESASSFYMIEYAGVNADNGDAEFYLNTTLPDGSLDKTKTNDPDLAERVILGSPYPDVIGGLSNDFTYKNFDLSFTFQGQWGASIYNNAGRFQSANGDFYDNQTRDQLARWQQPGDITNVPQARFSESNGTQHSSRYLQNADFIRLRNLTLGYSLPDSILKKINIDRVRIYFTGLNLLTITGFDGYDPESTDDSVAALSTLQVGESFYSAPPAKTYTLGINIDL